MSFGMIPLSPDDKPDSYVLLSMYEKLESENAKLRELVRDYDKMLEMSLIGYDEPDARFRTPFTFRCGHACMSWEWR